MVVRFPSAAEIVKTLESDAKLGAQFKDQKLLQKIGNTFAFKDTVVSKQSQTASLMTDVPSSSKRNSSLMKELLAALDRVPRETVTVSTCHADKDTLLKALKSDPKLKKQLKNEKLLEALAENFSHKEVAEAWRPKQYAVAQVLHGLKVLNGNLGHNFDAIQECADALDRIPSVTQTQVMR